ncbi:MAG: metal-sulfur cluster assembly factor [Burkholderiales bacterium]|nr:metal-sulfur cluster assembly factor [Burkholderiales bacterium]
MNAAEDPTEERVLDALRTVVDPEVGMNIVDLGLVYGVEIGAAGAGPGSITAVVKVSMTMTSAACPMADLIVDQVHEALAAALPRACAVEVEMVWEPPWTPERMSGLAREQFGWAPR